MHEMSIAEGIVDIALDTLKANEGHVIHAIQLNSALCRVLNRMHCSSVLIRLLKIRPPKMRFCKLK